MISSMDNIAGQDADCKVVRARGLPWSVTPDDIAVFFAGCDIKGGKMQGVHIIINDEGGNLTLLKTL